MTTLLSSGPVIGSLSASGSSPVFSTTANQAAFVVIGLSRLASSVVPSLMRSTDNGSTWATVAMASPGPAFYGWGSEKPKTFFSASLLDTVAALYRIDVTLSGGSVFFLAQSGGLYPAIPYYTFIMCSVIEPGDPNGSMLSMTTAQLVSLHTARNTPLTPSQITAPLTLYKRLNNYPSGTLFASASAPAIAQLSVPSDALTAFDSNPFFCMGSNRTVRASKVQVTAVMDSNAKLLTTDANGLPLTSIGVSWAPAGSPLQLQAYKTGDTIIAVDSTSSWPSTGPFTSSTCHYGIHGFTTLLEAVCYAGSTPLSLSAFGL